jgi:hypothetical protein
VILRLTTKAKTKIHLSAFDPEPALNESPFLHEWWVNHSQIGKKWYFVFSEALTLYTVFMPSVGITTKKRFEETATDVVFNLLKRHREITQETFEAVCSSFTYFKTNNRRILGTQNELIWMAQVEDNYREDEARLEKVNRTPVSYLSDDHFPDLAFERRLRELRQETKGTE